MLLANLEIGLHEQRRLQLEIAAALDAAIIDPDHLKSRILEALLPRLGPFRRLRLFIRGLLGWKSPSTAPVSGSASRSPASAIASSPSV
jgi:hypothetical protein